MARLEVITGSERRRTWSDERKRALVAEAFAPGAIVAEVARRAAVLPGQIYRWRREIGDGASGFASVIVAPGEAAAMSAAAPAIEVEFPGKVRVRIPASIPPALAAAVVKVLVKR
jgi:transposase